jgi:hypothetical protein
MEDPNDFGSIMQKVLGLTPESIEVLSSNGISKLEDLSGNPLPSEKLMSAGLIKDEVSKLETFRQWYRSVPPYAKASLWDHCDDDVLKAFALYRDEKSQSLEVVHEQKTLTVGLLKMIRLLAVLVVCSSLVSILSLRRNARNNTEKILEGMCEAEEPYLKIPVDCKKLSCSCCYPKSDDGTVKYVYGGPKKCSEL